MQNQEGFGLKSTGSSEYTSNINVVSATLSVDIVWFLELFLCEAFQDLPYRLVKNIVCIQLCVMCLCVEHVFKKVY